MCKFLALGFGDYSDSNPRNSSGSNERNRNNLYTEVKENLLLAAKLIMFVSFPNEGRQTHIVFKTIQITSITI